MDNADSIDIRLLESIINNVVDSILVIDEKGIITFANRTTEEMLGYSERELIGCKVNLLMPEPIASSHDQYLDNYLGGGKAKVIGAGPRQLEALHKNGSLIAVDLTVSEAYIESSRMFIGVIRDITERLETNNKINLLNKLDSLTGLSNRSCFRSCIDENISREDNEENTFIIIVFGIDRFNVINDSLGPMQGDMLLMAFAHRLRQVVASDDLISRLGGDEFAVLHEYKQEDIREYVRNLQLAMHEAFDLSGQDLKITVSVGVSVFPSDGVDADTLLKNALSALISAKKVSTGQRVYYCTDLNARSQHKLSLENQLSYALEREEFRLFYQPKVDLLSGRVISTEALIRWQDPDTGLVSPTEFVPLLEETGLIVPVGEWVLNEACHVNRAWQKAGLPEVEVGVNISPRQFQLKDFSEVVAGVLKSTGLAGKFLDLEITEGMLLHDINDTIATLERLQEMGANISIDDFGTGYSSLNYLQRLPIDTIKIDQSFIQNVITESGNMGIVRSIIGMSHNLNMNVVAEGVETIEQLTFLANNQCDLIQGYYFSKPLSEEDFTQLLRDGGHFSVEEIHGKSEQEILLIVDDEENIRSALVRALRHDNYHILTAGSAEEAFGLLAKNKVGVIVSDQQMPGMTGSQFFSSVRSMYPDTVRIILSGYADFNAVLDGINNGEIYKFLVKPWNNKNLIKSIRDAFKYYNFMRGSRKIQD